MFPQIHQLLTNFHQLKIGQNLWKPSTPAPALFFLFRNEEVLGELLTKSSLLFSDAAGATCHWINSFCPRQNKINNWFGCCIIQKEVRCSSNWDLCFFVRPFLIDAWKSEVLLMKHHPTNLVQGHEHEIDFLPTAYSFMTWSDRRFFFRLDTWGEYLFTQRVRSGELRLR